MEEQTRKCKSNSIRSIIHFMQGIAVTICILSITLAIYLIVLYQTRLTPFISYAIIFDAGSSHTEMFVYHWPADKSNGLGTTSTVNEFFVCPLAGLNVSDPVKGQEYIKLKAISDFEQHLHLLDEYFRPCLDEAINRIPSNRHKYSPIFLGATAGMRLVRLSNGTGAQHILETIREIFSASPFEFVVARQVRILTGIEEAVDGWITTNILLEKFKHRHEQRIASQQPQSTTEFDSNMIGVLDLGGASTQVTFTYTHDSNAEVIPDEFTTNITLFDTLYHPYAHSYLCWGKNEALKRYRARLFNAAINVNRALVSNTEPIRIRDPCLAHGTNDTMTLNSIFRSPCTMNEKLRLTTFTSKSTVKFIGSGNGTQCRKRLTGLFDAKRNDKSVNCSYKQEYCTFDHAFQPPLPKTLHFIGLSGYYYIFKNLAYGMKKAKGSSTDRFKLKDFSQDEILQRLHNVCETHYSILYQQEGMTELNEQHKRGLCFDAWYMWLLLTHGIGFKDDDFRRLTFAATFPTGKVGWTLGYMINQTNYIPAEYRERPITKTSFIGWLTGSITTASTALLFLLLTCFLYWRSKATAANNAKDGYNRANEQ